MMTFWGVDDPGPTNLADKVHGPLTNHSELDLKGVIIFKKSYINSLTSGAQDTNMLYQCMIVSLSKVGRTKVMVWEYQ